MFYAYKTDTPDTPGMDDEPLGTAGRLVMPTITTARGALARVRRANLGSFKLFRFTNFYDDSTFKFVTSGRLP
jgi:hypothetical protein